MTLEQAYDLAGIIFAVAVVASMIFVGNQLQKAARAVRASHVASSFSTVKRNGMWTLNGRARFSVTPEQTSAAIAPHNESNRSESE